MSAGEEREVCATLVRSPLHRATWVPFLPDTEIYDSAYAGPLRLVKEAAYERVQSMLRGEAAEQLRWVREDDDWILVR